MVLTENETRRTAKTPAESSFFFRDIVGDMKKSGSTSSASIPQ